MLSTHLNTDLRLWMVAICLELIIKLQSHTTFLKQLSDLVGVPQLVGESSYKPKSHMFDSQSGHIPRLWVWSLVGAHMRGN